VEHVGQYAPHDVAKRAGFRKGDVVVSFDGRTDFARETDVIRHVLNDAKPGAPIEVRVRRDGEEKTLVLPARSPGR
jgi:S1-C subfamily serine protease